MKKLLILLAIFFCLSINAFSQDSESMESETSVETDNDESIDGSVPENARELDAVLNNVHTKIPVDFFISMAPALIINTGDDKNSAVAPIVYPFSFGAVLFKDKLFSFQPRLSFYASYYLWVDEDDAAYPAEIENRTATVFSFLLDLPAVYTMQMTKRQSMEFGFGPAANLRFTIISNGVSSSDAGSSGSAGKDTDEIRSYMWKNCNWLYMTTSVAYNIMISERLKLGPELKFYIPCGQLFTGNGLNAGIISLGIKALF